MAGLDVLVKVELLAYLLGLLPPGDYAWSTSQPHDRRACDHLDQDKLITGPTSPRLTSPDIQNGSNSFWIRETKQGSCELLLRFWPGSGARFNAPDAQAGSALPGIVYRFDPTSDEFVTSNEDAWNAADGFMVNWTDRVLDERSECPATACGFVVSVNVSNDRKHVAVLYARYSVRATQGTFSSRGAKCFAPLECQVYDRASGRRCGPRITLNVPHVFDPLFGRWSAGDGYIVYSDLAFNNVCVVRAP